MSGTYLALLKRGAWGGGRVLPVLLLVQNTPLRRRQLLTSMRHALLVETGQNGRLAWKYCSLQGQPRLRAAGWRIGDAVLING